MKRIGFLVVFLFSLILVTALGVSASNFIPLKLSPLDSNNFSLINTTIDYTWNMTNSSDCSDVILSYSKNITTNPQGEAFVNIDTSSLTYPYNFLCEYHNGSLISVINASALDLDTLRLHNINSTGNLVLRDDVYPSRGIQLTGGVVGIGQIDSIDYSDVYYAMIEKGQKALFLNTNFIISPWLGYGSVTYQQRAYGTGTNIGLLRAQGTEAAPSTVANGNVLAAIHGDGWHNVTADWIRAVEIRFTVDGPISSGSAEMPTRIDFMTTPDGSTHEFNRMSIKNNGLVNITNGSIQSQNYYSADSTQGATANVSVGSCWVAYKTGLYVGTNCTTF